MLALGLSAAALYCLPLMGLEDSRDGLGWWQLTEVQVIDLHYPEGKTGLILCPYSPPHLSSFCRIRIALA